MPMDKATARMPNAATSDRAVDSWPASNVAASDQQVSISKTMSTPAVRNPAAQK